MDDGYYHKADSIAAISRKATENLYREYIWNQPFSLLDETEHNEQLSTEQDEMNSAVNLIFFAEPYCDRTY
jgi:hypothetical protein